eukprot:2310037-Lingulodinium_polyedra.AAC.1
MTVTNQCPICSSVFHHRTGAKRHVNNSMRLQRCMTDGSTKIGGADEPRTLDCPDPTCDKVFTHLASLQGHIREHLLPPEASGLFDLYLEVEPWEHLVPTYVEDAGGEGGHGSFSSSLQEGSGGHGPGHAGRGPQGGCGRKGAGRQQRRGGGQRQGRNQGRGAAREQDEGGGGGALRPGAHQVQLRHRGEHEEGGRGVRQQ